MTQVQINDKRKQGWFRIDNKIIDQYGEKLGPYGIALYAVLARAADFSTHETFRSIGTLAKSAGMSHRKAIDVLHSLAQENLIEIEPRFSSAGDRTSNIYHILDVEVVQEVHHPMRQAHDGHVGNALPHAHSTRGSDGGAQYQDSPYQDSPYQDSPYQDTHSSLFPNPESDHNGNSDKGRLGRGEGAQKVEIDGDFQSYWELHPGPKGSKQEAIAAYKAVRPPAHALAAMERQIAYKAACDRRGAFCPQFQHLHRWFKKRRWEDEIPTPPMSQAERLAQEVFQERYEREYPQEEQ